MVKEYIKYGVFYTNTSNIVTAGEYYRWGWPSLTAATQGFGYVSSTIGSVVTLADAFARIGDTDLYNYTSSEGMHGTTGGPKNLQATIATHYQMQDHHIIRYRGSVATTEPNQIIDSDCDFNTSTCNINQSTGGVRGIGDVILVGANNRLFQYLLVGIVPRSIL